MSIQGWIVLAMLVVFLVYLLPALVRSRQVVLDSRVEDRYSGDLRILARAGETPAARNTSDARTYLHPHQLQPEPPMDKPIAPRTFAAADARRAAAARAARAAASARRAAAAKRRMVLTLALLGLSSVAWVLVAMLPQVSVPVALAPTLLLTLTLVLGRRAALQGAAADARMAAEVANAERRAAVTASAAPAPRLHVDVNPADLIVEPEARTLIASAPVAVVRDREWTPVPVPPPAYTLKAAAPRRKIEPLVVGVDTQPAKPSDALTEFIEPVVVPTSPEAVEPVAVAEPALNVQEVLARRRAVG